MFTPQPIGFVSSPYQNTKEIPKGLGAMGLKQAEAEKIADGALGDHCHLSTPRQPTKAQYVELIEQSWG